MTELWKTDVSWGMRFRWIRVLVLEGSLETVHFTDEEMSTSVASKASVFFQSQALLLYIVNIILSLWIHPNKVLRVSPLWWAWVLWECALSCRLEGEAVPTFCLDDQGLAEHRCLVSSQPA